MTTKSYKISHVCYHCIGDRCLKQIVLEGGEQAKCKYCGTEGQGLQLSDLAEHIHEVLQEHFELAEVPSPGYEILQTGETKKYIILDIAQVEEEVADDIVDYLSERYSHNSIREEGYDPYDQSAYYEEKDISDLEFRLSWRDFCKEIRTKAHFFNTFAYNFLKRIFENLDELQTFEGPVIREVLPNDPSASIWRGRIVRTNGELNAILKSPDQELGPPPYEKAMPGRMNARGVSVFYGATEGETCIAELRAPVDSQVVLAKFVPILPLRLLELEKLKDIYCDTSHFSSNYMEEKARFAFLAPLVDEICRPIMPWDSELEYLPTQAVAEFLAAAQKPKIDGIIYRSSQTQAGQNVVLLNHASKVFRQNIIFQIKIYQNSEYSDLPIEVSEVKQSEKLSPKDETSDDGQGNYTHAAIHFDDNLGGMLPDLEDEFPEDKFSKEERYALRLNPESVCVFQVKSVTPDGSYRKVLRCNAEG